MRSYAQVVPTFWTRGSGKRLRGNRDAQVLALYLMTAPGSNLIGLYYLPLITICHETGLTEDQVREALPAVSEIAQYDFEAELVWLPECARYQIGEAMAPKDKRRAAVEREVAMVSGHRFAQDFLARYGERFGLRMSVLPEPHPEDEEAPSKGYPRERMPPSPVPDPVPVRDPDRAGAREPAAGEPVDNEGAKPMSLGFELHPAAVSELSKSLGHPPEVIREAVREFVTYWTIGGGRGKTRAHWQSKARDDVLEKHRTGKLDAIARRLGLAESSPNGGKRAIQLDDMGIKFGTEGL